MKIITKAKESTGALKGSYDMTTGSPIKAVVSFMLPLFLSNMFQQLYSLVDTVVVGARSW